MAVISVHSPVRAPLCAHVGTDEQANGQSPESQLAACEAEALRRDWQVAAETVGPGVSGRKVLYRPGPSGCRTQHASILAQP
jgi:hypothetical protein